MGSRQRVGIKLCQQFVDNEFHGSGLTDLSWTYKKVRENSSRERRSASLCLYLTSELSHAIYDGAGSPNHHGLYLSDICNIIENGYIYISFQLE